LASISRHNAAFAPRIEAIARAICPETAESGSWEQALIIGECTTILSCVAAERIALIEQPLGSTCARVSDAEGVGRAEPGTFQSKPAPPRDELEPMGLAARDLAGLERYERRALSRRKRAVESLIAIQNNTPPSATRRATEPLGR
jgi:hypothetical protein